MVHDRETDYESSTLLNLLPSKKTRQPMGVFSMLVTLYEEALELDPCDVEANFNLASLYLQKNETEQALKHY